MLDDSDDEDKITSSKGDNRKNNENCLNGICYESNEKHGQNNQFTKENDSSSKPCCSTSGYGEYVTPKRKTGN